jgi:hypothetical protein
MSLSVLPRAQLMAQAKAFADKVAVMIRSDARAVVKTHLRSTHMAVPEEVALEMVDSLHDAEACLKDATLNDAALTTVAGLLKRVVVVKSDAQCVCYASPCTPTCNSLEPAVLITAGEDAYHVDMVSTLGEVRARLTLDALAARGLLVRAAASHALASMVSIASNAAASTPSAPSASVDVEATCNAIHARLSSAQVRDMMCACAMESVIRCGRQRKASMVRALAEAAAAAAAAASQINARPHQRADLHGGSNGAV